MHTLNCSKSYYNKIKSCKWFLFVDWNCENSFWFVIYLVLHFYFTSTAHFLSGHFEKKGIWSSFANKSFASLLQVAAFERTKLLMSSIVNVVSIFIYLLYFYMPPSAPLLCSFYNKPTVLSGFDRLNLKKYF